MKKIALSVMVMFISGALYAADNSALKDLLQIGKNIMPAVAYRGPEVPPVRSTGANLTAASYDKTQKIIVTAGKVTVGEELGIAEISGIATGKQNASMDGTMNLWLSIFRYKRPDGTTNHVAGWNISLALKAEQTSLQTAEAFATCINAGKRPYKAKAAGNENKATITIVFTEK